MTGLVLEDVWKDHGSQIVLERVNLTIAPRAFVALVGASGCGKSTLLKLLPGQEAPSRGRITLDGAPPGAEPGPDRGVVFQRYSVFAHLPVLGNVMLGNVMLGRDLAGAPLPGRLLGAPRRAARDAAQAMVAAVGLAGSEGEYPAQLSGGMQQRLALAQALMMRPKVLLLDGPFGALDPGIRAEIHTLMRRLWHETPMTVVMVTHDLCEAFTLATRVIALERPRDRPEERERHGAVVSNDIAIWPPRVAGSPAPDSGPAPAAAPAAQPHARPAAGPRDGSAP